MHSILRQFGLLLGVVLLVVLVILVAAAIVAVKADWLSRLVP